MSTMRMACNDCRATATLLDNGRQQHPKSVVPPGMIQSVEKYLSTLVAAEVGPWGNASHRAAVSKTAA